MKSSLYVPSLSSFSTLMWLSSWPSTTSTAGPLISSAQPIPTWTGSVSGIFVFLCTSNFFSYVWWMLFQVELIMICRMFVFLSKYHAHMFIGSNFFFYHFWLHLTTPFLLLHPSLYARYWELHLHDEKPFNEILLFHNTSQSALHSVIRVYRVEC
jgi:hypothetical protein